MTLPLAQPLIIEIAKKYRLTLAQVRSRQRTKNYVAARLAIMKALHERGYGYAKIGRLLCRNEHTVQYHVKVDDKRRERNRVRSKTWARLNAERKQRREL